MVDEVVDGFVVLWDIEPVGVCAGECVDEPVSVECHVDEDGVYRVAIAVDVVWLWFRVEVSVPGTVGEGDVEVEIGDERDGLEEGLCPGCVLVDECG